MSSPIEPASSITQNAPSIKKQAKEAKGEALNRTRGDSTAPTGRLGPARRCRADHPVPVLNVSPGSVPPQGCRHLLASPDRRLDPPDGPDPEDRSFHLHSGGRPLDRPALDLPGRDQLAIPARRSRWADVAKCVVTCVAMLLLVTSRRREWPVWVMLVVRLPALLVLGGRTTSVPRR